MQTAVKRCGSTTPLLTSLLVSGSLDDLYNSCILSVFYITTHEIIRFYIVQVHASKRNIRSSRFDCRLSIPYSFARTR